MKKKKAVEIAICVLLITLEYFHKKGYFVNNMMAVRKCVSTIYTEANYKGFSFTRTFYFVHEFNM